MLLVIKSIYRWVFAMMCIRPFLKQKIENKKHFEEAFRARLTMIDFLKVDKFPIESIWYDTVHILKYQNF